MPFVYNFFNKRIKANPEDYFFADYPYYLTNLLLNGTDITTDEQIISITDDFNKLLSDKNYSQIEVAILEPNKKWELEDKRWLQYLEHDDDFELHDENGEVIYVFPNKFILERL